MKARWILPLVLVTATVLQGCGFVRKPWGKGTYIPAAVCAVIGAGAGVGVQELRTHFDDPKCVTLNGQRVSCASSGYDDWKGALVGTGARALLCGLAGHYLWEPERA